MRKLQGSGGNWAARSAAGLLRNSGHATELMRGGIIPIILSFAMGALDAPNSDPPSPAPQRKGAGNWLGGSSLCFTAHGATDLRNA